MTGQLQSSRHGAEDNGLRQSTEESGRHLQSCARCQLLCSASASTGLPERPLCSFTLRQGGLHAPVSVADTLAEGLGLLCDAWCLVRCAGRADGRLRPLLVPGTSLVSRGGCSQLGSCPQLLLINPHSPVTSVSCMAPTPLECLQQACAAATAAWQCNSPPQLKCPQNRR